MSARATRYLYAFDLQTGKRLWRAGKPAPWVVTSPVVWGGRIYYGSSDGHYVEAVDPDSGKRVWLVRTPDNVIASPVLADSILYVADMSGNLFALDAATGAERWRTSLGARVFSTPVPTDGALYLGADDGAVYAIRGAGPPVASPRGVLRLGGGRVRGDQGRRDGARLLQPLRLRDARRQGAGRRSSRSGSRTRRRASWCSRWTWCRRPWRAKHPTPRSSGAT